MFKMAWYDWKNGMNTSERLENPWYEYLVDDSDAMRVAEQEVMLAWNGELKRWRDENGYGDYPPDVCIKGMRGSMTRRSSIGYTVFFIENAFRVEPVDA